MSSCTSVQPPPPCGWSLALLHGSPVPQVPSDWGPRACLRPPPTTKPLCSDREGLPSWPTPQLTRPGLLAPSRAQTACVRGGCRGGPVGLLGPWPRATHRCLRPLCVLAALVRSSRPAWVEPGASAGLLRPRESSSPSCSSRASSAVSSMPSDPDTPVSFQEDPVVTLDDQARGLPDPTSEPLRPQGPCTQTLRVLTWDVSVTLLSDPWTQKAQCCPPASALSF